MLIYNHKFEFVGIDKQDLSTLGFNSLEELQNYCDDFADLFVKKPSYIYNFKNFKWILYILNSNSEQSKAIISVKDRAFAVDLSVDIVYLTDNPKEEGYKILFRNLHQIDGDQVPANLELVQEPSYNDTVPTAQAVEQEFATDEEKDVVATAPAEELPDDPLDIYNDFNEAPTKEEDDFLDLLEDNSLDPQEELSTDLEQEDKPMLGDYVSSETPSVPHDTSGYVFDPEVAAKELGLPVDLIEEFIGDFIQQAHNFKHDLYNSLNDRDFDQLKNLSHKLKGVSANLRIEDAFEALVTINTSNDPSEIRTNLDHFYLIIAKLEGKEPPAKENATKPQKEENTPVQEPSIAAIDSQDDDDLYTNLLLDDLASDSSEETTDHSEETTDYSEPIAPEPDVVADTLNYNKEKASNELGLDQELIEQLLQDYKEQLTTSLDKMQNSLDDAKSMKHFAVSLKGVSDNLRLDQISEALSTIISSDDKTTTQAALASLEQYTIQL